ncbi:MAG: hypothetical protein AB7P50_20810 [Alphaproteobacteria bacterium]
MRRESARRIAALEQERAFAFRRFNLMRAIVGAVGTVTDAKDAEAAAVANAVGVLRGQLEWTGESAAHDAVVAHFAPVAQAVFAGIAAPKRASGSIADVRKELAKFEAWYAKTHAKSFWTLFETYMRETPVVDF